MPWTISTLAFDTVDGQLDEASPVDTELTRPGADGTAFHVDAWRAPSQTLTTTVRKATSALTAFRTSCFKLQTTVVGVVDQHGDGWTVYVRRVRLQSFQQVDGLYLLRATWVLVPMSERPA